MVVVLHLLANNTEATLFSVVSCHALKYLHLSAAKTSLRRQNTFCRKPAGRLLPGTRNNTIVFCESGRAQLNTGCWGATRTNQNNDTKRPAMFFNHVQVFVRVFPEVSELSVKGTLNWGCVGEEGGRVSDR